MIWSELTLITTTCFYFCVQKINAESIVFIIFVSIIFALCNIVWTMKVLDVTSNKKKQKTIEKENIHKPVYIEVKDTSCLSE